RVLSSAGDRSRRLRRAGLRGGRARDRRDRANRARVEDQPGARRPGASRHAACGAGRVGAGRRQGGRRGLRRRRSPARARRHGVRSRGKRDPRMARLAGSDVQRRRRSDRPASARTRDAAVTPPPARQAADAGDAYVAIRSVAPGGLGRASEQDVAGTPTATLRDAMALARDRDAIAREYATDFETTFEIGAPGLRRALFDGLVWREAVVE